MDFFNGEIKTIFILINTILLIVILFFVIPQKDNIETNNNEIIKEDTLIEKVAETPSTKTIKVDIKGLVENPGVYEVTEGTIINELIVLAGGTKENASTKYINLSKKLENEMVINIYSEEELNNQDKIEECHCDPVIINECLEKKSSIIITDETKDEDSRISINNATKEELMKLNGIGEVKAKSIIEYRQINGLFNSIEEIKNVSGITESIYEKIKDYLKL